MYHEVMSDCSGGPTLKPSHPAEIVLWLYPVTSCDNKRPSLSRWGSNCNSPLTARSPTSALSLSPHIFSLAPETFLPLVHYSAAFKGRCRQLMKAAARLSLSPSCSLTKVLHSYMDNGTSDMFSGRSKLRWTQIWTIWSLWDTISFHPPHHLGCSSN